MKATSALRVCTIMSADLWAGAEVQVATAASYLAGCPDVALSAVLFNHGWLERRLTSLGIETAVVDEHRHTRSEIVSFLARFLRGHAIDLVHTHRASDNVLGSVAARLARVPHLVRTVHGLSEPVRGWARARGVAYETIDKAMLWLCADRIIAVSRATSDALARSGYRPRALTTIHNGIDLEAVQAAHAPGTVRRALGVDEDALLIGTAGRLAPVKGHEYLIRAAACIAHARPDVRVLLTGSGPRKRELVALARTLGVARRCLFLDPAAGGPFGVHDLVGALDVFVLPSLSEGIPMALLEALALRKPVVASAVGGVPEVICNRVTGLLVEPRSPRLLAEACLELSRRPDWAAGLAAAGRDTVVERFSRERNGAALARLYLDVAGDRPPEPAPRVSAAAMAVAPFVSVASRVRRRIERAIERRRAERIRRNPAPVLAAAARARRVLVVCHGNIIRSPFAARLLAGHLHGGSRPITVASAGLRAEPGRPSHSLAIEAAAQRGVDLRDHAARRLLHDDVASADAIFVMDIEQWLTVRRLYPDAAAKTFLITSLAADTPLEVRDPIDADAPVFQASYAHLTRAVQPLARALARERR